MLLSLTSSRRADSLAGLAAASAGLPLVARHNCQLQARRYLGNSLGSGDARTPKTSERLCALGREGHVRSALLLAAERRSVGLLGGTVHLEFVDGDLLSQEVEAIVNAWNRNIIPWWLLLPQGVSGAIKRRAGYTPFRELGRKGPIPLGGAVLTGAGRLPYKAIIHVAGINMLWRSSEVSIRDCVKSALALAKEGGFKSIAFPLIGAGTGGGGEDRVSAIMRSELESSDFEGQVKLVRFRRQKT